MPTGPSPAVLRDLNDAQQRILKGLSICGHAEISASEWPEAEALKSAGLVEIWSTMGGCAAWRATPAGFRLTQDAPDAE